MRIKLEIEMDEHGKTHLSGPLDNYHLVMALLTAAEETAREYALTKGQKLGALPGQLFRQVGS